MSRTVKEYLKYEKSQKKSDMKILQLCMSQGFGGLELYVLKIAKYLKLTNVSSHVVCVKDSFIHNKLSNDSFNCDTFSPAFHHLPLFSALKLAKYIDANQIDVVHAHWGKDLLFAVLAKVFSKRNVKLIYTRHMALTRKKDDFYHRFLYRNVDAYLVITKSLYTDAVKFLPLEEHKIKLLYLGVPAATGKTGICTDYLEQTGLDKEPFNLVIFGRIEDGKGQHFVVAAVKKLIQKGIRVHLSMIGHIMDEQYFSTLNDEIKKDNLENNIHYLGFHDNPTSIMSCFDAVVLATKCETFGLVLPEAMRAGVAVIGSNCGGVPEIIEHERTGLLFETENSDDLALQLEKIISDSTLCERLAKAGKADADQRFSEEAHFKQLMECIESA